MKEGPEVGPFKSRLGKMDRFGQYVLLFGGLMGPPWSKMVDMRSLVRDGMRGEKTRPSP